MADNSHSFSQFQQITGLRYDKSATVEIVVDPSTITTEFLARFGRELLRLEWAEHRDLLPEADNSHLAQQIVDDLHSEFVAQSGPLAWLWQHMVPRVGGELSHCDKKASPDEQS